MISPRSKSTSADVHFVAYDHGDRRGAEQAPGLDVPPLRFEERVARSGEPGEIRHGRVRDEANLGLGGDAEHVGDPAPADLLEMGRDRGSDLEHGVLIPGGGEHVGGECGRERAADDESEVPSSGA